MSSYIDVEQILKESRLNKVVIVLVVLAFSIILFDGFDLAALSYAAPRLIAEWKIGSRAEIGVAFSASLAGMVIGAPLSGMIADKYGRKTVVLICCALMGLPSLAVLGITSLPQLLVLRFITGLGLGGAAPTLTALTAEFAPPRHRALMITVMYSGISAGAAVAGLTAAWIVPLYGWKILFLVGGVMPVVFGLISAIWMPESLKFIAVRCPGSPRGIAMAERLSGHKFGPATVLVVHELVDDGSHSDPGIWPRTLFLGRLSRITPMLWISKVTILMAYYYTTSWLPTLLGELGVQASRAATAAMFFQVGGAIGGLVLSHWIDRRGLAAVALLFLFGVPCVSLIGFAAHNTSTLYPVTFFAGLCVMGVLYGLNAISAIVYPTAIRTYGAGWAAAVGRLGAIAGPMLGAACLSLGLSIETTIVVGSLPLLAGAISSLELSRVVDKNKKTQTAINAV